MYRMCVGRTENAVAKRDVANATRMLHAARAELQDARSRIQSPRLAPVEAVRLMTRFADDASLQESGCAGAEA